MIFSEWYFFLFYKDKLNQLREFAMSDTSEENELTTPEPVTPLESYFSLNPTDMDNYLNFKAVNHEKLTDWDPVNLFIFNFIFSSYMKLCYCKDVLFLTCLLLFLIFS